MENENPVESVEVDTSLLEVYNLANSCNNILQQACIAAYQDLKYAYTESFQNRLTYAIESLEDILINQDAALREHIHASGKRDHENILSYVCMQRLLLSNLNDCIVAGRANFFNPQVQRGLIVNLQEIVGITTIWSSNPQISFKFRCFYHLTNITEH